MPDVNFAADDNPSASSFQVRPLEARDLHQAPELWPNAMTRLCAAENPTETTRQFSDSIAKGNQNVWVAETSNQLVGMAVVWVQNRMVAHLIDLFVLPTAANRAEVASALARSAIRGAWEGGYLKLVVHTQLPADRLIEPMHDQGFTFSRAGVARGEPVVEFYRNLYEQPRWHNF